MVGKPGFYMIVNCFPLISIGLQKADSKRQFDRN